MLVLARARRQGSSTMGLLSATCAVAAAGQLCAPLSAVATGSLEQWASEDLSWGALAVAPGERAVEVAYVDGGCDGRNLHPVVSETRARVAIARVQETNVAPGIVCPAFARHAQG